jgi:hypothetical protein
MDSLRLHIRQVQKNELTKCYMKKILLYIFQVTTACFLFSYCASVRETQVLMPQEVAIRWAEMTLYITKNTPANSPTYASRALGYIGVTMYESVVHGYPSYNSLAGQLNGLEKLPLPEPGADYEWVLSLNAAQAAILKKIYNQTSDANKHRIDSLAEVIFNQFSEHIEDEAVISRSVAFGNAIADAVFGWALHDGGHRAYLRNFDKSLVRIHKPGLWEPPLYGQSFSHYPLHPHWGENRTFLAMDASMEIPPMISYDTTSPSAYRKEFLSVLQKSKSLTQEEKEIALWWGDDPSDTFTPPGHSYYLATLVLKKTRPELIKCAETYSRVGIAVADAFINCWKWKYHYYAERPSSYITRHMDERWESFWPDPPFPAFPSGHAIQAAATATVLTDLFGENFTLTDDAHAGRAKDELRQVEFKPRNFTSFWQIAEETANSRFYGGIHTPQDNNTGLNEGKKIGGHVNQLDWRKSETFAQTNHH